MDAVNNPKHYTSHPSGVECLTVVRHMNFNRGNAVKYIWRASLKGKEIEDLEKAIFYLKDEIERLKRPTPQEEWNDANLKPYQPYYGFGPPMGQKLPSTEELYWGSGFAGAVPRLGCPCEVCEQARSKSSKQ
jgi:hypothetical protein